MSDANRPWPPENLPAHLPMDLLAADEIASLGATETGAEQAIGEPLLTELYLYMLGRPNVTENDLIQAGFTPSRVRIATSLLQGRGMVVRDGDSWCLVPPSQSLPGLADRLEERARTLRASIPGLIAAHRAAERSPESSSVMGVERLIGTRKVSFAMMELFSQAGSRCIAMRTGSLATRHGVMDMMPTAHEGRTSRDGRRLAVKTVLDAELIKKFSREEFDGLYDVPTEDILVAPNVPFTALVSDQGSAVVEVEMNGEPVGVIITDRGLVTAVHATVTLLIQLGTKWREGKKTVNGAGSSSRDGLADALTPEEKRILELLATGLPDATIARRLGISSRTLDRRLRSLLDRLNAANRFQAGVLATQRGWL